MFQIFLRGCNPSFNLMLLLLFSFFISLFLPFFTFPIYIHHYTFTILLFNPIKDLKYTIPLPDSPNSHFIIIYAFISFLFFIQYYNIYSYIICQISSLHQHIPIFCPCFFCPPISFIIYLFTFYIYLNFIIYIYRSIIYSIK